MDIYKSAVLSVLNPIGDPKSDRPFLRRLLSDIILGCCIVCVLCVVWINPVLAQGSICDARLKPTEDALGYRVWDGGQRCEGLYQSTVSAIDLEIVSVLWGTLNPDPDQHTSVQVAAPDFSSLNQGRLRVRAVALPLRTYYRMDAVMPGKGSMLWPLSDVLKRAKLPFNKIGIYGWVGENRDRIFIPLRVVPDGTALSPSNNQVKILIRSTRDVDQLAWRTDPTERYQVLSSIPVGKPVTLLMPAGEAKVLQVEVQAKQRDRDQWAKLAFQLFRPGE